jgi:hypothetical protein
MEYWYVVVPPDAEAVTLPLVPPLHVGFTKVFEAVSAVGCVMVTVVELVQGPCAVRFTVYVPAGNPAKLYVVPEPV